MWVGSPTDAPRTAEFVPPLPECPADLFADREQFTNEPVRLPVLVLAGRLLWVAPAVLEILGEESAHQPNGEWSDPEPGVEAAPPPAIRLVAPATHRPGETVISPKELAASASHWS